MADSVSLSGTTLPDDGTLIETQVPPYYHQLGLDSYETVISKYGVTVDEKNPWKAQLGIPIDPVHLRPLVETIRFLYNKCHLHEASQIRSKSKRLTYYHGIPKDGEFRLSGAPSGWNASASES